MTRTISAVKNKYKLIAILVPLVLIKYFLPQHDFFHIFSGFLVLLLTSINLSYLIIFGHKQFKVILITFFIAVLLLYVTVQVSRAHSFVSFTAEFLWSMGIKGS